MSNHRAYVALFLLLFVSVASPVQADVYPEKPIRFIVPFPPGGGLDIVARLIGDELSATVGWKVVIENRAGAAIVGTDAGAKARPDGYTFTYGTNATHGIFGALYRSLPYDPVKDFAAVTKVADVVNILVSAPALPVNNVQELIRLAKAKPHSLNYAAAGGLGSQGHLAMELLKVMGGVQIEHIGYQGPQAAVIDLLSGRVQMMITNVPSVLPHVKAGKLKALAVVTEKRTPLMPEVPTIAESGLEGYVSESWWGLFAPAETSPTVVGTLNREVRRVLKRKHIDSRLRGLGLEPRGTTSEHFAKEVRAGMAKWAKVIADAGVPLQ